MVASKVYLSADSMGVGRDALMAASVVDERVVRMAVRTVFL